MHARLPLARTLLTGLLLLPLACHLQAAETPAQSAAPATPPSSAPAKRLEPRALDILQAMSKRLSAAQSLSFSAITSYESPSRLGPPLAYYSHAAVSLLRPNHLRVITRGDGPASEFYYDGKQLQAYMPAENLLAVSNAPAELTAALQQAYNQAAIYWPFTDLIVANPYKDLAEDMKLAFYIGQSTTVGDTTTDIIAYANDQVFVQAWIGTEDQLPRMLRAVFSDDPAQLRHELVLRDWQINPKLSPSSFAPMTNANTQKIEFAAPTKAAAEQPTAPAKP